jgi:hypothetical protein
VGFEGNRFTGEIVPEINKLIQQGTVRMLDLLFIKKDEAGTVTILELDDMPGMEVEKLSVLHPQTGDWIAQDDIEQVGQDLPNQSSVAMVLIEHLWAIPLQEATLRANGKLLAETMISRDVIAEVEAYARQQAA